MTSDVVILVPRRPDGGERDRLWSFARAWWAETFPTWPIVEGLHHGGAFNRSAAVNVAAAGAGEWDVAVIIDADVLPDRHAIEAAVVLARAGRPAIGYDRRLHLTQAGTEAILSGYRGDWRQHIKLDLRDSVSGAFAIGRPLWEEVGGFDERFVGWGWEDVAFAIACEALAGDRCARVVGALWHLWHTRSPEAHRSAPTFARNEALGRRYKETRRRPGEVRRLVAEAKEERGLQPEQIAAVFGVDPALVTDQRERRIPRILHRTVPAETTPEVEAWWAKAQALHPGWVCITHRDPLDEDEWETADLWDRCRSGAQRAGLIRLEALWRYGGVYIDSDVELYRPLDPLLGLAGFSAWEDAKVTPDAVLGAHPGHPAVAAMLDAARASIIAGGRAWASGPGVTTATLPGRADWLLLPPGSFYPYHYTEKEQRRGEDHATAQPWAFGAHHWHHSWSGR